jgi:alkylated DNA repair protein alkB family protein 8
MSEQIERELMEFIERRLEKSSKSDQGRSFIRICMKFSALAPLKNRRVLHFGHKFNYKENNALERAEEGIPTIFDELIDKILDLPCQNQPAEADYRRRRPNQVTVNVYEPGQGIPPHTDTHSAFAEPIWSLSLGSDVVMEFRDGAFPSKHVDVLLPPRSLMEMRREARYCFKHWLAPLQALSFFKTTQIPSIMSRKYDVNPHTGRLMPRKRRMSITFRLTSSERCQCPFPEFCDWDRGGRMRVPDTEAGGERLEREYVGEVPHFVLEWEYSLKSGLRAHRRPL